MFTFKNKFKNLIKFTNSTVSPIPTPDSGCFECFDTQHDYGSINSLLNDHHCPHSIASSCKDIYNNYSLNEIAMPVLTKCRGKKKLTTKKFPRHQRPCSSLSKLSTFLAKTRKQINDSHQSGTKRNMENLHQALNLEHFCQQLKSLRVDDGKIPAHIWSQVSGHDKKILSCMTMKRTQDIAMLEDARIASQYWKVEENIRKSLQNEQKKEYLELVNHNRLRHTRETKNRIRKLELDQIQQQQSIIREIAQKDFRAECMLKNVKYHKDLQRLNKTNKEYYKHEAAIINQKEKDIEEHNWQQRHLQLLQERINRAELLRNRMIQTYKYRLKADNELAKSVHTLNFEETQKFQQMQVEQLNERIQDRYEKLNDFVLSKTRDKNASQNQAKISAALRDMVKQSVNVENPNYRYLSSAILSQPYMMSYRDDSKLTTKIYS